MNLAVLLGVALAAAPASAAPSLTVSGELPCSRDELAAALALRVGPVDVRVHGTADRVRVEVGGRDQVIALDGVRGAAAARRIALAAQDLALPELPDGAPEVHAALPPRLRLSIDAQVATEVVPRAALAAGVELGRGAVRATVEAGLAGGTAAGAWLIGVPVRAGVALGDDPEIRVAAVAMPFVVQGGSGDRNLVGGAGVEMRGHKRAGSLDLVYLIGIDGFVKQVEYTMGSSQVFTTPWVALRGGLGVEWRTW